MPVTGVDVLMGLMLITLLVGPWTWMDNINIKWSTRCMYLLPVMAFFLTFGKAGYFNPKLAMFSNDGPVGIMHSAWMQDAVPGGTGWMDSYWIGGPGFDFPITISYIVLWCCNNPNFTLFTLVILMFIHNMLKRFKYL